MFIVKGLCFVDTETPVDLNVITVIFCCRSVCSVLNPCVGYGCLLHTMVRVNRQDFDNWALCPCVNEKMMKNIVLVA